jgi:hypothetical protein
MWSVQRFREPIFTGPAPEDLRQLAARCRVIETLADRARYTSCSVNDILELENSLRLRSGNLFITLF